MTTTPAMFGLDAQAVQRGVTSILFESEPNTSDFRELFARIAWSVITEPGDAIAGAVLSLLGAAPGLEALVSADPSRAFRHALAGLNVESADEILESIDAALKRWLPRVKSHDVMRAIESAARCSARLLTAQSQSWPSGLDDLGVHAPLVLWCRGSLEPAALDRSVGMVGARAASGYGEHVALESAAGLVDRGFAVVSGAAYGIDGAAHRAALASSGRTVAFLAGGVDRFYPSGHHALLERIAQAGAVLSEVPCGTAPTKWRFLQRNRLISAASPATVVVEAGWRSGSLNTAGHAAALGRPLGAVPGPVTSPASAGCHRLIREYGAVLVTSAHEMAELVDGESRDRVEHEARRSSTEVRVIDALSTRNYRPIDDIARRTGLAAHEILTALGMLSIEGLVSESDGGWRLTARR